ncbi:MAG: dienelactone hydrolase family protein [Acidobacteria bacterium]|nr:dienelactone hydrolase family protein [Acidobacteriota bacterium]
MERKKASDFDQELLNLFDRYVHGIISRREFLEGARKFAVGGLSAAAILESLNPKYVEAQQIAKDDERLKTESLNYSSPEGYGTIRAYLVRPANARGKLPGIVVIHENRGLTPHIGDIARRLGIAGFLALAPDGLTPVGGYPGDDDAGRELQSRLDGNKMTEDFVAAAGYLKSHPECTGKVGAVGFCIGGGYANRLAVRIPDLAAAVAFYGPPPPAADVPRIKAPLLLHYAGLDDRVNAGWPAFEAALKANNVGYSVHFYPGANHGFNNDTTPRYDEGAAKLAWQRTLDFFNQTLR